MGFKIIIPARYASTRLPAKPLRDIAGKSLLQRVYDCAVASSPAAVIIATDDARIRDHAVDFGARVCLTASTHQSGTERIAEVISQLDIQPDEVIVNLQGDEPMMPPACISQVAGLLSDSNAPMATLSEPIDKIEDIFNPNIVKVVVDARGHALYFSRAPIPWYRDGFAKEYRLPEQTNLFQRHIGLYAYRAGFIHEYIASPPTELERIESLEQLRVLHMGKSIRIAEAVAKPGPGVDTEEDLAQVIQLFARTEASG